MRNIASLIIAALLFCGCAGPGDELVGVSDAANTGDSEPHDSGLTATGDVLDGSQTGADVSAADAAAAADVGVADSDVTDPIDVAATKDVAANDADDDGLSPPDATASDSTAVDSTAADITAAPDTESVSPWGHLCAPCNASADCVVQGVVGLTCAVRSDGSGHCAAPCVDSADCPTGYTCQLAPIAEGPQIKQCLPEPTAGTASPGPCACDDYAVGKALKTGCWLPWEHAGTTIGRCPGERMCQKDGLTACTATTSDGQDCIATQCDPQLGKLEGDFCDDGQACTKGDVCKAGKCVAGAMACACQVDADCAPYEDGDACNGTLSCVGSGADKQCVVLPGAAVQCDLGKNTPCTTNVCQPKTGTCLVEPLGSKTACDDGGACTIGDHCDGKGACAAGTDICLCHKTADCKGDGDACNGTSYCDLSTVPHLCKVNPATVVVCPKASGACEVVACNAKTGACETGQKPDNSACDDNDACTGFDACKAGVCTSGGAICQCATNADCAAKDDGDLCNGILFCDKKTAKCAVNPTTVVNCPTTDDTSCTRTVCQPKTGACQTEQLADGAACADGNACTESDACAKGRCAPGTNTCPCKGDGDCSTHEDGEPCNGTLFCDKQSGKCALNPATIIICKDGLDTACQRNACVPVAGTCTPTAVEFTAVHCHGDADANPVCNRVVVGQGQGGKHSTCDDGDKCTVGDACRFGACESGTQVCECNKHADCKGDGDVCLGLPFCNLASGLCEPNPAGPVVCNGDDDKPCVRNLCQKGTGTCAMTVLGDGAGCDDGSPCAKAAACQKGACAASLAVSCDDGNVCSSDACDPDVGCVHKPRTGACPDSSQCTSQEACVGGACLAKIADCDDTNPCTDDTCAADKGCVHLPTTVTAICSDGDKCTAADRCQGAVCKGDPRDCDDANTCTDQSCSTETGCVLLPREATCDDADPCTATGTCVAGGCKLIQGSACDDNNPCTADACDEKSGKCSHDGSPLDGDKCDDNNLCTRFDACAAGVCKGPVPLECDKGDPCSVDLCEPATGCVHNLKADGERCKNGRCLGLVAVHARTCKAGACVGGGAFGHCGDDTACTDDACSDKTGDAVCSNAANSDPCDDGNPCTISDVCNGGTCLPGKNECACSKDADCAAKDDNDLCNGTLRCDRDKLPWDCRIAPGSVVVCDKSKDTLCAHATCTPTNGKCAPKAEKDGLACDADGSVCTENDACASGACAAGTPLLCEDNNPCTDDSCDPLGGCRYRANTAPCDADGNKCTVPDTCVATKCVAGPDKSCDDGNACTLDTCAPQSGACSHDSAKQDGKLCDADANFCTEDDTCKAGKCLVGTPLSCDDKNICTTDKCAPAKGCVFLDRDVPCNDGKDCTIDDFCLSKTCTGAPKNCADANACTADLCDEVKGCYHADNSAPCDDGDACTAPDVCAKKACTTTPNTCDDGAVCTADSCVTGLGCRNTQVGFGSPCDDGSACTLSVCVEIGGRCSLPLLVSTVAMGFVPGVIAANAKGHFAVAEYSEGKLYRMTSPGTFSQIGTLKYPRTMAYGPDGGLYVASAQDGTIHRLDGAGKQALWAGGGNKSAGPRLTVSLYAIDGLSFGPDGDAWFGAGGGNALYRITSDGHAAKVAGGNGQGSVDGPAATAKFFHISGTAVSPDGTVWITDSSANRIRKFSTDGNVSTVVGSVNGTVDGGAADALFSYPRGCVWASGRLLVIDGSRRLRQVTPQGTVSTITGSSKGIVNRPQDGPLTSATFGSLGSLTLAGDTIWLSDGYMRQLRRVGSTGGEPCDDSDACTDDTCDPKTGCKHAANATVECDDASLCTLSDTCKTDAGGTAKCVGTPRVCDDSNPCTSDSCAADTGCVYSGLAGIACDDGKPCTDTLCQGPVCEVPRVVRTFVGSGSSGAADGTGTAASFKNPAAIATDAAGNMYVADVIGATVRKVTPAGVVKTLAGSYGSTSRKDGQGSAAVFYRIYGLGAGQDGNLYAADSDRIRKITLSGAVSTLMGSDGKLPNLYGVQDAGADKSGSVYVMLASRGGSTSKLMRLTNGVLGLVAGKDKGFVDGKGDIARFSTYASRIEVAADGTTYIADWSNYAVRRVKADGTTTTVAGSGVQGVKDGKGAAAGFEDPTAIALGPKGGLFVLDSGAGFVRHIDAVGNVRTLAGTTSGYLDGPVTVAKFKPYSTYTDLTVSASGVVYVADGGNVRVRSLAAPALCDDDNACTTDKCGTDGKCAHDKVAGVCP